MTIGGIVTIILAIVIKIVCLVREKNGKEVKGDLDFKAFSYKELYDWVRDPNIEKKTSLITFDQFVKALTPYLENGIEKAQNKFN